ncbi:MAG: FmdB family zinc ribbon protein [Steroidobacter sp.]
MPFYEYECTACKFYVEALQKISDEPLKKCPSCKKQTMKKLVSAPVFRLKGGGWYETDFKSDKEEKRNLAEREEAPEAKAEEAKPDATKDAAKPVDAKATESKPVERAKRAADVTAKSKSRPAAKPVSKPKPKPKPAAKKSPPKKKARR